MQQARAARPLALGEEVPNKLDQTMTVGALFEVRVGDPAAAPKNEDEGAYTRALIRWSVQEIRRVAMRLAQRRIRPAHVIAWSVWRRAHQAAARKAHIKRRSQL